MRSGCSTSTNRNHAVRELGGASVSGPLQAPSSLFGVREEARDEGCIGSSPCDNIVKTHVGLRVAHVTRAEAATTASVLPFYHELDKVVSDDGTGLPILTTEAREELRKR